MALAIASESGARERSSSSKKRKSQEELQQGSGAEGGEVRNHPQRDRGAHVGGKSPELEKEDVVLDKIIKQQGSPTPLRRLGKRQSRRKMSETADYDHPPSPVESVEHLDQPH